MKRCSWYLMRLKAPAKKWLALFRKRKKLASGRSPWWSFVFESHKKLDEWLEALVHGTYRFEPMQQYRFEGECVRLWGYRDRLMLHVLLDLIKPTFTHILSPRCFHTKGPHGVAQAIDCVQRALDSGAYQYVMRVDIHSYYASIQHEVLLEQLTQHFDDPRLHHYFDAIVTTAVDDGGTVFQPKKGIPRRSSLSPFFGALYLSPLDKAFTNKTGLVYARYMDDIVILTKTKRQFARAKKILFTILKRLKLKLSPSKSWMGEAKPIVQWTIAVRRTTGQDGLAGGN